MAEPGWQPPPPGSPPRATGTWHAVIRDRVKIGWVTRESGEALCGPVRIADPPHVLFTDVECRPCLAIAWRERITIIDPDREAEP